MDVPGRHSACVCRVRPGASGGRLRLASASRKPVKAASPKPAQLGSNEMAKPAERASAARAFATLFDVMPDRMTDQLLQPAFLITAPRKPRPTTRRNSFTASVLVG